MPAKLPITVSHPGKIFWPEKGYTKLDLVEYYNAIFPYLSPYVKDRMLSLERCPDGMEGECFFQKQKPESMPPGTPTKRIAHADNAGKFTDYVVGGSLTTQTRVGKPGVHRRARHGKPGELAPAAGLGMFRHRSRVWKVRRRRPCGPAHQSSPGPPEVGVLRQDFRKQGPACPGSDPHWTGCGRSPRLRRVVCRTRGGRAP